MNANLWRKVVARLSPEFRCVAFDLPLREELPRTVADLVDNPGRVHSRHVWRWVSLLLLGT